VGPRASLDAVEKKNLLPLPGLEPRPVTKPTDTIRTLTLHYTYPIAASTRVRVRVRVRVTLRLAVYRQSVRLGAKSLEIHDHRVLSQAKPCCHSPYVTFIWRRDGFVAYEYLYPYQLLVSYIYFYFIHMLFLFSAITLYSCIFLSYCPFPHLYCYLLFKISSLQIFVPSHVNAWF
jgi:hypothetical protein